MTMFPGAQMKTFLELIQHVMNIVKLTAQAQGAYIYGTSMSKSYGFFIQLGQLKDHSQISWGLREWCRNG
jgi:hypothetical protein